MDIKEFKKSEDRKREKSNRYKECPICGMEYKKSELTKDGICRGCERDAKYERG